MCDMEDTLFH